MVPRLLVLALMVAGGGGRSSDNKFEDMAEFDPVALTRCDIVCQSKVSSEKEQDHISYQFPNFNPEGYVCRDNCLVANGKKMGTCPNSFDELPIFAQACVEVCTYDSQCPGIEKCCIHSCGVTCQTAVNLSSAQGLPHIPTNVSVRELRGPSLVEVQWSDNINAQNGVLFLIEARYHFGRFYREESLSSWTAINQASKKPAIIRGVVLPARWYLFRVAAVNVNGTRGYSLSSQPFSLSRLPGKPGRPKKLGVTHVREVNGTVWADLRWGRPKSEVPVRRYKIFWSCRLPGHLSKNASDSVLVHQRTIPKSQQIFQLKNLKRDELYFIQVQAMAIFGREKLKGTKADLFFNTTRLEDQVADPIKRKRPH